MPLVVWGPNGNLPRGSQNSVAIGLRIRRHTSLVPTPTRESETPKDFLSSSDDDALGEVYLAKSGRYYKIGRTNDRVRRGLELKIQLPEKLDLIRAIVTDPSGVEAYWHRRFEAKRMQGEWFDLTAAEVTKITTAKIFENREFPNI